MTRSNRRGAFAALALAACFVAAPAGAQSPPSQPVGPAADDIRNCLCLKRAVDNSAADMSEKQQALETARHQLADLDAALQRDRAALDVNNEAQVAQFRQKLAQRDALYNRISRESYAAATAAVQRYNAQVGDYNGRCSNRPFDSVLMSQVQATLVCAPE
jgi:hypothetical protein